MKKSLLVASLLFIGTSLMAADTKDSWFVGGEFGGMNMKYGFDGRQGVSTLNFTDTIYASYEAIKVGKYFDYGRVYGSLGRQNKKDAFSSWNMGVGYDYLFKNSSSWTPFIGVNGLYTKGKDETTFATLYNLKHPEGFSYGAEVGLIYAMASNVDFEVGARYMNNKDVEESRRSGADYGIFEGKQTLQYYIGINYKF